MTPAEQIAYLRDVAPDYMLNDILAVCDLAERALLTDDLLSACEVFAWSFAGDGNLPVPEAAEDLITAWRTYERRLLGE